MTRALCTHHSMRVCVGRLHAGITLSMFNNQIILPKAYFRKRDVNIWMNNTALCWYVAIRVFMVNEERTYLIKTVLVNPYHGILIQWCPILLSRERLKHKEITTCHTLKLRGLIADWRNVHPADQHVIRVWYGIFHSYCSWFNGPTETEWRKYT